MTILRFFRKWAPNLDSVAHAISIIFALHGGRALDGFGTFLTPLKVICYILLMMIYQLSIMASSTNGRSH